MIDHTSQKHTENESLFSTKRRKTKKNEGWFVAVNYWIIKFVIYNIMFLNKTKKSKLLTRPYVRRKYSKTHNKTFFVYIKI